jgi:hypothetical protein
MNPIEVIKAIKEYGVPAALVIVVMWQQTQIKELDSKVDNCMNERIQELIRLRTVENTTPKEDYPKRMYAILVDPVKVKKRYT